MSRSPRTRNLPGLLTASNVVLLSATRTSLSSLSLQLALSLMGRRNSDPSSFWSTTPKPLPKGLIHELLPDTEGHLPTAYARKQLPAQVLGRLNYGERLLGEPFAGRIATPTMADGYIKDNSVLKMIENSLYEGALYQYRDPIDGSGDVDQMLLHLNFFWTVVAVDLPRGLGVAARQVPPHARCWYSSDGLRHGRTH